MGPLKSKGKTLKEIRAYKQQKNKWKHMEEQKETIPEPVSANVSFKECRTVSIAIPGTILENAQSPILRCYLANEIARAASIFQVDEIVIYDEYGDEAKATKMEFTDEDGTTSYRKSCIQMARILQYLECPQYLRKYFFPKHEDLQYAGGLKPLGTPHHLKQDDEFLYREGVTTNKPVSTGKGSMVYVGLLQDVCVDKKLLPGIRCTVKMLPGKEGSKKLNGILVSPKQPREHLGVYWGYKVRLANSISQVFSKCNYKGGYDLTIGTSDKGTSIDEFEGKEYKHLLIVFGGIQGIEAAIENDNQLKVDDPKLLFDHYLNTQPNQGTKTIRSEEALLITLTALRAKLNYCSPLHRL